MRLRSRRPGHLGLAVLAVVAVTAACGIPTTGGPTAIAKGDVPSNLLSPASPTTPTSTVPPEAEVSELIFLAASTGTVAPVSRYITVNTSLNATLTELLGALLVGPTPGESAAGLQSYLSGAKTRVTAKVADGIATVDFTANPIQVVGTSQTLAIAQVVFTATAQPGVTSVVFQLAGQPLDVQTASGATVSSPVDRTSYQPQAPVF
jgi:spore germination protein GerM